MPHTTLKNRELLSSTEPPERAQSDPGCSCDEPCDEAYEEEDEDIATEEDSSYDGTDSDQSISSDILNNFATWRAQLRSETAAHLTFTSSNDLNTANLAELTQALATDSSPEEDENENASDEESLDENGRPIARLTKGYQRSNVTDSDDGSEPVEDETAQQETYDSQDSAVCSSPPTIPSEEARDNEETSAGASAPSTPSSDGIKRLSAYGWTPRRKSSLEEFPSFDFDYIPYSRSADVIVSAHTERGPSRGRQLRTASFGASVQQNQLKRAGFVPVPYDVAMARAVELALMDDPDSAPDTSMHPLYAKQTLEIPPRAPPFQNVAAWSRPPMAYRALELEDSDLKDCCLTAPICNDCNTKICAKCGSTCVPDPCWCVVGGCTRCPVVGGNVCRYHVDKWEAKGRPDTLRGHPVSRESYERRR